MYKGTGSKGWGRAGQEALQWELTQSPPSVASRALSAVPRVLRETSDPSGIGWGLEAQTSSLLRHLRCGIPTPHFTAASQMQEGAKKGQDHLPE